MNDTTDKFDTQFYQLIVSLHAGAMQQLGKVASPFTGEIERDLDAARGTIDMIDMLKRKTAGNLTDEENRLVEHVLYELRMNYVDESKKGDEPKDEPPKTDSATDESSPASDSKANDTEGPDKQ
ncbi:DUF1844 domain-containing protein [candidate division GN15 bacterium]|nr:DUF1844 domain-containing protein [candidate division GN15 bacterium]